MLYTYYAHIIQLLYILHTYTNYMCTHRSISPFPSTEAIWKPMLHLGLRGFHQGTFEVSPHGKNVRENMENGGKYREHVDREYIGNDGINYGKFWEDMGRCEMCGCISDNQKPVEYWTQKMQDDSCIVFCVESNTGSI